MFRHRTLRTPRRRTAVAIAAVTVLLAGACSSGASDVGPGSANGGSFSVATPTGFVSHFIPGQTGSSNVDYAVWTPLTRVDPETGEVENAVAKSIESQDQKTWEITLEEGWTFHDGTPVTAQSFADAWNAAAYGENGWIGNYQFAIVEGYSALNPAEGKPTAKRMSGIEVTGDHTMTVTLTKPTATFPYILASTTWAPMPASAFDDLKAFDRLPIGNGPFQVTGEGLEAGAQGLTLERYEEYGGEPAAAEEIQVKFYQDSRTAYTSFTAGEVDLALVDGSSVADATAQYGDSLVEVNFPAVVYLGFPLWDERFEDPRVREAMALALDRESIATALLRGAGTPATSLAPESIAGSEPGSCPTCELDATQAQQLLEQAGGWNGPLTLWTYQDPTNSTVLEAVANQLRENLGIEEITLETQTAAQIYESLPAHEVNGPFLLYTGVPYPHLYAMAESLFQPGSFFNVTGYEDQETAQLLADAVSAAAPEDLTELSQQAVAGALEDVPLTPVYFPKGALVHSDRVGNVTPEVLGGAHLAAVTVDANAG